MNLIITNRNVRFVNYKLFKYVYDKYNYIPNYNYYLFTYLVRKELFDIANSMLDNNIQIDDIYDLIKNKYIFKDSPKLLDKIVSKLSYDELKQYVISGKINND